MHIAMSQEALEGMLRAAYEDGFEDGAKGGRDLLTRTLPNLMEEYWPESVTADRLDAAITKFRNGGRIT